MMFKNKLLMALGLVVAPYLANAEALLYQAVESTTQDGYDFLETNASGDFLYAIKKSPAGIESFSVGSDGGLLPSLTATATSGTPISATLANEIAGANSLVFSPASDFMLMANDSAGGRAGLYAYYRGAGGGFDAVEFRQGAGLTLVGDLFADIVVQTVLVAQDGKTIYVAGRREASLSVTGLDVGEGVIGVIDGVKFNSGTSPKSIEFTTTTLVEQYDTVTTSNSVALLENPVGMALLGENLYVISDAVSGGGADDTCTVFPTAPSACVDALLNFSKATTGGTLTFKAAITESSGAPGLLDPKDIVLMGSSSATQIMIAASGSSSILQFEQTTASLSPSLKKVYSAVSDPKISGLNGVSNLEASSVGGVLYAASPSINTITPLRFDNDLLELKEITDGLVVQNASVGSGVQGLSAVDQLAVGNAREHLYADSIASTPAGFQTGIARLSRQSNLTLVVKSQSRRLIQPGQIAGFVVTATNEGVADAPGFNMTLSPSHTVTDITSPTITGVSGTDAATCKTSVDAGISRVSCTSDLLKVNDTFTINIAMVPRGVTTASLRATVFSSNEIAGVNTTVSDSDEIKVGEFKNGTLATNFYLYLLLLGLHFFRSRKKQLK